MRLTALGPNDRQCIPSSRIRELANSVLGKRFARWTDQVRAGHKCINISATTRIWNYLIIDSTVMSVLLHPCAVGMNPPKRVGQGGPGSRESWRWSRGGFSTKIHVSRLATAFWGNPLAQGFILTTVRAMIRHSTSRVRRRNVDRRLCWRARTWSVQRVRMRL